MILLIFFSVITVERSASSKSPNADLGSEFQALAHNILVHLEDLRCT